MPHALRTTVAMLAAVFAGQALAAVSCSVSATGPAFGIYSPLSSSAAVANGTLTVSCTLSGALSATVAPYVYLSSGGSGSYAPRRMYSGTNSLGYNLYWSTAYSQIWGDGTGGTYPGSASISLSLLQPTNSASGTMYGQIPAGQDVAPGTYTDSIVVTVNY